jgi:hypothetical protein
MISENKVVYYDWKCPYSECSTSSTVYSDPETTQNTTCSKGHVVKLVRRNRTVSPRVPGRVNKHIWNLTIPGGQYCRRCGDKWKSILRGAPIYGCVGNELGE